jgi:hypothetical protein
MPALGWKSPTRKSIRLDVPVTVEQDSDIRTLAAKLGITRTDAARQLLDRGIRELKKAGQL